MGDTRVQRLEPSLPVQHFLQDGLSLQQCLTHFQPLRSHQYSWAYPTESKRDCNTRNSVQKGAFDLVVTNPPFGKKLTIDERDILRQFQLGHQWKFDKDQGMFVRLEEAKDTQAPQILFVERCLEFLKPGGQMGIILPESMFSNPSHRYIIQYLESVAKIRAVVSMPEELFQPYTHAKTLVAVIEKNGPEKGDDESDGSHPIFMARALWCGHDSRGLPIVHDDIPKITERFQRYCQGQELDYDHLGFVTDSSEIVDHIYLPKYYNPEIRQRLLSLEPTHDLVRLGEWVNQGVLEISTGDEVGKLSYGTGNFPFIRTWDLANWEIKADPKHGLGQDIFEKYKDKQDAQEHDILMVRDGTYLVGTCAMVTKLDTKIVYQSHIYKIRSTDHDTIDPHLLLAVLSSPLVQDQIYSKRFTQDIIDTLGARIHDLVIPIPKDEATRSKTIGDVKRIMRTKVRTRQQMSSVIFNVATCDGADPESEYSFFLRNIT